MANSKSKLTCGVGVNDADYVVQKWSSYVDTDGKRIRKVIWSCPFFSRWKVMISRCYFWKRLQIRPSYTDCEVCESWLTFSNFRAWMETQDWEDKQLDKDILIKGNKIYSPETCVFISGEVNNFLLDRSKDRGKYLIGVSFDKKIGCFRANCSIWGKQTYLGIYSTQEEAHEAWRKCKHKIACELADVQPDNRVANALRKRYLPENKEVYV